MYRDLFSSCCSLCSETVVSENILSSDDSTEAAIAGVDYAKVTQVVQSELLKHLVESVVKGHSLGTLNKVGA